MNGATTAMAGVAASLILLWDDLMKKVNDGELSLEAATMEYNKKIKDITPKMKEVAGIIQIANALGLNI